jgi:hypothetical protein
MKFAWEESVTSRSVVDEAVAATEATDVLVVIGYSFPFFNRMIDRRIIRSMKKLTKVYFQSHNEKAVSKYILSFRSIMTDATHLKLEPILDAEQFFLPPEL